MMTFRPLFLLFLLPFLAACSLAPVSKEAAPNAKRMTLLMAAHRHGALEPCGCSIAPLGGVEREWNALQKVKAAIPWPGTLFPLSAGTTFVSEPKTFRASRKEYNLKRAAFLVEALNLFETTLVPPAADDLALGLEGIRKLESLAKFPFVSTNLFEKRSGKPLFKRYLEMTVAEMDVLFLGVSSPSQEIYGVNPEIEVKDPEEAIHAVLNTLPKRPRFIVLLSSLPHQDRKKIHMALPEIQLVLGASAEEADSEINQPENSFAYFAPLDRGRSLAKFAIEARGEIKALTNKKVFNAMNSRRLGWQDDIAKTEAQLKDKKITKTERQRLKLYSKYTTEELTKSASYPTAPLPGAVPYDFEQVSINTNYDEPQNKLSDLVRRYKEAIRGLAMNEGEE